jgi:hypothetical protein
MASPLKIRTLNTTHASADHVNPSDKLHADNNKIMPTIKFISVPLSIVSKPSRTGLVVVAV